jgi:hypothetical protein
LIKYRAIKRQANTPPTIEPTIRIKLIISIADKNSGLPE